MKKLVLFLFTAIALTSCDWTADPKIIGVSEIEADTNGRYICRLENEASYCIDSVLTIKNGTKLYETPIIGKDVTVFTFDSVDNIYFYRGIASSEEIKRVYFQGSKANGLINVMLILLIIFILYGLASHVYAKSTKQPTVAFNEHREDTYEDEDEYE